MNSINYSHVDHDYSQQINNLFCLNNICHISSYKALSDLNITINGFIEKNIFCILYEVDKYIGQISMSILKLKYSRQKPLKLNAKIMKRFMDNNGQTKISKIVKYNFCTLPLNSFLQCFFPIYSFGGGNGSNPAGPYQYGLLTLN